MKIIARKLQSLLVRGRRHLRATLLRIRVWPTGGVIWTGRIRVESGVRIDVSDGGRITVGRCVSLGRDVHLVARGGYLELGERVELSSGVVVVARDSIVIGQGTLVGEYSSIRDQDHAVDAKRRSSGEFTQSPVVLGENVWVGARVTVTQGVTIGDGAVLAAGAVVTRAVPPEVVVGGVPATVIRGHREM